MADYLVGLDGAFQQHHHFGGEGLEVQQVFQLERIRAETPNRYGGAGQSQRRNDGQGHDDRCREGE